MTQLVVFLNGVSAAAALGVAAYFYRIWHDIGDRLFLWFAIAFCMFAANWTAVALLRPPDEARFIAYLPRLGGFLMILGAVIEKNRR